MNAMARKKNSTGSKRKFSLNPLVWLWRIFFWGFFCAGVVAALVPGSNCGVDARKPQQHQLHANPLG